MLIKWVADADLFAPGFDGMVGEIEFFYFYIFEGEYFLVNNLPGVDCRDGPFKTEEEAKKKADQILKDWLDKVGLTPRCGDVIHT